MRGRIGSAHRSTAHAYTDAWTVSTAVAILGLAAPILPRANRSPSHPTCTGGHHVTEPAHSTRSRPEGGSVVTDPGLIRRSLAD